MAPTSIRSVCVGIGILMLLALPAEAMTINVSVTGIDEFGVSATQQGDIVVASPGADGVFTFSLDSLPANVTTTGRLESTEWTGSFD